MQYPLKSGRDQSVRDGRFPLFWVAVFDCTTRPFSRVPRRDDPFLEKLFPLLKDKSAFKEIPRIQRFADRPALEEILQGTEGRAQRDAAILKACHVYGYTQAHVAAATGLHYSTVSKIIRKVE